MISVGTQIRDCVVRDVEFFKLQRVRLQDSDKVKTVAAVRTGDAVLREERVARKIKHPLRPTEFSFHIRELNNRAGALAVQIPPITTIRYEVQDAGRTPFGLEDRLVRASRHKPGVR